MKCRNPVLLIINADDYGYFTSVSSGIAEGARRGIITATGVMANGPRFDALQLRLHELPALELGIHLNLTYGRPLTKDFQRQLDSRGGLFKSKMETAALIMKRSITQQTIKAEWRAQIERCLEAGLTLRFLNSHEHIHILPLLSGLSQEIAQEYGIENIRQPRPDWGVRPFRLPGLFRNVLMQSALLANGSGQAKPSIPVLGIGVSGRLSLDYLARTFARLVPGKAYELMCHPGYFDPNEIKDPRLCGFHVWEQELALLTGQEILSLMSRNNIKLARFSELSHFAQDQGEPARGGKYPHKRHGKTTENRSEIFDGSNEQHTGQP